MATVPQVCLPTRCISVFRQKTDANDIFAISLCSTNAKSPVLLYILQPVEASCYLHNYCTYSFCARGHILLFFWKGLHLCIILITRQFKITMGNKIILIILKNCISVLS